MTKYEGLEELIDKSNTILILQADNPDGDSLASALALEQILGDKGKEIILYCGVDIPTYLRHLAGWDRVTNELPKSFDMSIIVDTSSVALFEKLSNSNQLGWIKSKPCVVIDHHSTESSIDFSEIQIIEPAVATGEIIYEIATKQNWPLNQTASELIAISIMSDSLGLVSEGTTARSIHIIGNLVEAGVSLAALDDARRQSMRKHPSLLAYKGDLLKRVEFYNNNQIAIVTIPWNEIEKYSPLYNPSMLVIDEMRSAEGCQIAIAFKHYPDGKITAKIRSNYKITISNKLAEHFGGGGHPYASGFKVYNKNIDEIKAETIKVASELLNNLSLESVN